MTSWKLLIFEDALLIKSFFKINPALVWAARGKNGLTLFFAGANFVQGMNHKTVNRFRTMDSNVMPGFQSFFSFFGIILC